MQAGFARESITPPVGTRMLGFLRRDREGPSAAVHDELYVRALYMSDGDEQALVASLDLLFLGREDADRIKAALGAALGLEPRQVLLATTHTHAGPAVGTCLFEGYLPPEAAYLERLDAAVLEAARRAAGAACPVTLWAGRGRSTVPMSRRRPCEDCSIAFSPNPEGTVCDSLPVVALSTDAGEPVALLFSISCHPSTAGGFDISADYPGVACRLLDEHLGAGVSMFIQGAGGDAKASASAREGRWVGNDRSVVEQAGRTAAEETIAVLEGGLEWIEPELHSALVEEPVMLAEPPSREGLQRLVGSSPPDRPVLEQDVKVLWARRQLEELDRVRTLTDHVPILIQGIQLGRGLRLVAVEGEAVAELGRHIERSFPGGLTIPVGYANGQGLYLVVSRMLAEGGYEVESYWEYGWPAPLAEGVEHAVTRAAAQLRELGIW